MRCLDRGREHRVEVLGANAGVDLASGPRGRLAIRLTLPRLERETQDRAPLLRVRPAERVDVVVVVRAVRGEDPLGKVAL